MFVYRCVHLSVGACEHQRLQIPLVLEFQVVGGHLRCVLGTELVSLGKTGCDTNGSDFSGS